MQWSTTGRAAGSEPCCSAAWSARARELGVSHFVAELRTDNRAMLTLFKRAGVVRLKRRDSDVSTIDVELPVDGEADALGHALRSVAAGDVEPAAG